jgi:uncharacterized protein DUF4349
MSAIDWNELDGYEALVSELRASPPVAPERLRQRILERAPRARRRMSPRRRLAFVVVPVAVALAVGTAVVHGVVSSGSKQTNANEPVLRVIGQNGSAAKGATATTPSAAGEQVYAEPARPKALTHLNADRNSAVVIPRDRLVHADASLQVQVPSHAALSKATNEATQIVSSLGGYAQSVQYQSSHNGDGNAFLALRVPVGKAETAIGKLGALGKLVSQQVSTQDLQQQLTHETNQIGSLRRAIAVYEQALKSGTLSAAERVEIQIKLSNARHALIEQRKARTGTLASGATADVSLTLTTNKNGIVGPTHHKSGRFDRLLGSAAGFLALEGIVVLYGLVVLSPILLIGGLAWWLLRERRRREETRLLASA